MVLSHKHKFIFIKNQKVAGSSLEKILYNYLGESDICTGSTSDDTPSQNTNGIFEHVDCKWISKNYPVEWKYYYKFTIERNPWDKAVSYYYWLKYFSPEYVKNGFEYFIHSKILKRCSDWNRYTIDDQIIVDDVILYDELHDTLKRLNKIPYDNEMNTIFQKSSYRPRIPYQLYYSESMVKRVEYVFSKEIYNFNFKF